MPRKAFAHHPVILTKVRTQGTKGQPSVALGPDFRQDDCSGLATSETDV